jgi:hypothetical protein
MKKLLKVVAVASLAACLGAAFAPSAFADTLSVSTDNPMVIEVDSEADLFALNETANKTAYENYNGYTIEITKDITLTKDWTPLTDFQGTMVGVKDDVISGLKVENYGKAAGLCGNASGAAFEKLTIKNAVVNTTASYAGAFAGDGFTSSFTDCEAINVSISGYRFVGGIVGSCYGNITRCKVLTDTSDTSVVEKTTIKSANSSISLAFGIGDNVGGIIGYIGEGNTVIYDCRVNNIEVTGSRQVGGIAGFENYGNTVDECKVYDSIIKSASNSVKITISYRTPAVGGVTGQFGKATEDEKITCSNNYVENTTIIQNSTVDCYAGWAVGDATSYGSKAGNYIVENNTKSGVSVVYKGVTSSPGDEIGYAVE